jgi:CRISPR-associated exonuclease Cas4
MNILLIFAAILVAVIAIIILRRSAQDQRATGLPEGRVIYTDTKSWGKVEAPLYDSLLRLTGKPDYLIAQNDNLVPVEVKSSSAPLLPYESHIFQLAAYCLLVERSMGKRPPHGILSYRDRSFSIDYTQQIESDFLDLLVRMRAQERRARADRSHEVPGRCARCGYRQVCDQKL